MPVKGRTLKTTVSANGHKIGRPRAEVPANAAEVIRQACATTGATRQGAALALGVSREVLDRWLDERPELQEAFDQGRETERRTLHSVLYEAATKGSGKDAMIAAMFLLKSKHGYREGDQGDTANRVQITFALPGAMKPEQFIEEQSHESSPENLALPRTSIERS